MFFSGSDRFSYFPKKWQNRHKSPIRVATPPQPRPLLPITQIPQISQISQRTSPTWIRATDPWFARPECYSLRHHIFLLTMMKIYEWNSTVRLRLEFYIAHSKITTYTNKTLLYNACYLSLTALENSNIKKILLLALRTCFAHRWLCNMTAKQ